MLSVKLILFRTKTFSSPAAGVPHKKGGQVVPLHSIQRVRQQGDRAQYEGAQVSLSADIHWALGCHHALKMTPLIYIGPLWSDWFYWCGCSSALCTKAYVKHAAHSSFANPSKY